MKREKKVKIDRTLINLKFATLSDYNSEEYEILSRILTAALEQEEKTNSPMMDVNIPENDVRFLFPELIKEPV